jgi:glycerol-3-phosphate cytidylyltransferase
VKTVIGYAPGVFDLFHVGHLNLLRRARDRCDHLIAGVVSDRKALEAKGIAPFVPLEERLEIVGSLRCVDEAVPELVATKLEQWRLRPFDVIFKGDDWRETEKGRHLERELAPVGVEVCYLPYTTGTSSTTLRLLLEAMLDDRP